LLIGDSSKSETTSNASKVPSLTSLSSAPKVEEFTPPEPRPHDPYPGYYLLPSGKYAAYDAEYYQTFYKKWQADYNKYVRDLEKGKIKGFEALDEDEATGVNAMEEMEKAKVGIQALEERKALTKGGNEAKAPKMNIKVCNQYIMISHVMIFSRVLHSAEERNQDISFPHCLQKRIKTGRHWKNRSRKVEETGKKPETNMVC
jgi:hypothetical protein